MRRLLCCLCLTCLVTSPSLGQTPESRIDASKPPGRLIDVGGYRLHIFCTGQSTGKPTVVLLHGLGDYAVDWALVQPEVARATRVCSYDRAGVAWSDPGPTPRGPLEAARELHALLTNASVVGPYVLVGHSWGGLIARVYTSRYPEEVAGMVLVDPTHEDMYWEVNGPVVVPRLLTDSQWDAIKPKGASARGERTVLKVNAPFDRLPADAQASRRYLMSLPISEARMAGGDVQEMRHDLQQVYALTRGKDGRYLVRNIPLVVLTQSPSRSAGPLGQDKQEFNDRLADDLAHASRLGKHVVATTADHHLQLTEPELVTSAIRSALDASKMP